MKKSLIALAALATVATAAQAQSSATVYGVIDLGYGTINHVGDADKRVSGLQNGGMATSRLGFRGVEDLGGGLKAGFTLEAELLADTGAQTSTPEALFARESSLSLSSNSLGELKLGRFNTLQYGFNAAHDAFGANNIGGSIAAGYLGSLRIENAIQFTSPSFNGVKVHVQTGTKTQSNTDGTVGATVGEIAGEYQGNRYNAVGLSYANGPISIAASTARQNLSGGTKDTQQDTVVGSYDFGKFKLFAGYRSSETNANVKTWGNYAGVIYPVSANLNLRGVYTYNKDSAGRNPESFAVMTDYNLSKRTAVYAIYAGSMQDGASQLAIVSTSKWNRSDAGTFKAGATGKAGEDQQAIMVGIRHSF